MKRVVKKVLRRCGYDVFKVPRNDMRDTRILYSEKEIDQLEKDIEGLRNVQKDLKGWNCRKTVRKYLTNERINSFHILIEQCETSGVSFTSKTVLDVGTCTGYLLRIIRDKHATCRLFGCDMQDIFVNLAQCLCPEATIFKADVLGTSGERKYDIVFCASVLEHIIDTERPIMKLLNMLEDDGFLVLSVPNGRFDGQEAGCALGTGLSYTGHVNFWSEESWQFYISRICLPYRFLTGTLGTNRELYAIIHKAAG